ncbi:hypothetical protein [Antrihabitans cavernicola]|uniref:hypothetical protein n=1 Tax=Antrihabitans cavernicola TaxID=2495913 RepID=UPI00165A0151|nr:hypothetical protein [Spelaeibacter cavernicola]
MLEKAKQMGARRLITRIVVTGAIAAVPLTVVAAPAMADPAPGVVQADRNWDNNHHDGNWDRDHGRHDRDNHWQQQGPAFPGFPGFPGIGFPPPPPPPAPGLGGLLPSGLFGSS